MSDKDSAVDLAARLASIHGGDIDVWKGPFCQCLVERVDRRRRMSQEFLHTVRRPRLSSSEESKSARVQSSFRELFHF